MGLELFLWVNWKAGPGGGWVGGASTGPAPAAVTSLLPGCATLAWSGARPRPGLSGQPREQDGEAGRVSHARQVAVRTFGCEGSVGTEVA